MPVAPWAKSLTEDVLGGPPVEVGKRYLHPDDGPIRIDSGRYWGEHGLSNFWTWTVESTGKQKSGYADHWPSTDSGPVSDPAT